MQSACCGHTNASSRASSCLWRFVSSPGSLLSACHLPCGACSARDNLYEVYLQAWPWLVFFKTRLRYSNFNTCCSAHTSSHHPTRGSQSGLRQHQIPVFSAEYTTCVHDPRENRPTGRDLTRSWHRVAWLTTTARLLSRLPYFTLWQARFSTLRATVPSLC